MGQTKIEWAEKSWNPITGCSPISEGCQNCYARKMANRLKGRYGYREKDPFRVTIHAEKFIEPMSWRKHQFVFVCSMGDLFHDDVPSEIIQIVFDRMAFFDQHTYLILTKRPDRMLDEITEWEHYCNQMGLPFPTPNIWLGVSVENQRTADERISILLQIPAAKRFVSVEPMLGDINIKSHLEWRIATSDLDGWKLGQSSMRKKLDWVICGGETGPKARPMNPDWVRSLRDQCQAAGVPFFFKQWGEWIPQMDREYESGKYLQRKGEAKPHEQMIRVGKKKAGRLLDGRLWEERPE